MKQYVDMVVDYVIKKFTIKYLLECEQNGATVKWIEIFDKDRTQLADYMEQAADYLRQMDEIMSYNLALRGIIWGDAKKKADNFLMKAKIEFNEYDLVVWNG